jgi:hypothetical protein
MINLPDHAMETIKRFFIRFIGEIVWQVHRGHGSFLTMEFGLSHLSVREPVAVSSGTSPRVMHNLKRRSVVIVGDWHFWVQYGDWKLATAWGTLTNYDPPGTPLDECLRDLDGQRLASVGSGSMVGSCEFGFDLGATLQIWPSTEIPDDQWSVYGWNGDIVTCRHDGELVFEKADLDRRVFKPLQVTRPSGT